MKLQAAIVRQLSPSFRLAVNIEVSPGITILFGPSGSGKSTVLRSIAGLSRPDSGRIVLNGTPLFDKERRIDVPPQRRRVGVVFQQLALFPHLTVAGNIGYGLHRLSAEERRSRIARIAEAFHISDILQRRPAQISGGERQRTALARTLVTEPAALLLDEPLSALDHRIQSTIVNDLRQWNDALRIPVLYVTHAHREVYALGERVIVLDRGAVVATGTPHDVLDDPGRGMIAAVAGFENLLPGRIAARRPAAGTMSVELEHAGLTLEVPIATAESEARVTVAIRAGDILIASAPPSGLSARNVLDGHIESLHREGPVVIVRVQARVMFVVHLTPASVDDLSLRAGSRVWLIIKTYSCRVAAG